MTKKILILGANAETIGLVETARGMGLFTVVVDPDPTSPAKRIADLAYDADATNLEDIGQIIVREGISGVIVGVADSLVPYYQQICSEFGLPCYANEASVTALCSKHNFASFLKNNGLNGIPGYTVEDAKHFAREGLPHTLVIKPSDRGAGIGMSVCASAEHIGPAIDLAMSSSLGRQIMVERYMECDDIFVYYTIIDGIPYLSATADRIKTKTQASLSQVCLAAQYPSKHTQRYLEEMNTAVARALGTLGIRYGVLLIQFFVDKTSFYAYDPGFRLQGEAPHLYLQHIFGLDQRKILLTLALGQTMPRTHTMSLSDVWFNGYQATTFWILLKAGTIGAIQGLEAVSRLPGVIHVFRRLEVGNVIPDSWVGTEKQTLARVYTASHEESDRTRLAQEIADALSVTTVSGEDMLLDLYRPEEIA